MSATVEREVDLHVVRPIHYALHERLENWARYVWGSSGRADSQPMFRGYRPYLSPRQYTAEPEADEADARIIESAVSTLPDDLAFALRWAYVFPWRDERRVCRLLEVGREGLLRIIDQARELLRERLNRAKIES